MLTIRTLHAGIDLPTIRAFFGEASDYWRFADRASTGNDKASAFFTEAPPGCDPATTQRLGLFPENARMGGVAVLSFGFPAAFDAYIGLLLIAPYLRGQGHGADIVQALEDRARGRGMRAIFLAVQATNPRAWAFWERQGFSATGHSTFEPKTGHQLHRLGKAL